jgi:hypothetical protein
MGHARWCLQPNDRNAGLAVWPARTVHGPGETLGVKVASAQVALELVFVLEGVGRRGSRLEGNKFARGGIQPPSDNIYTLISETGINAPVLSHRDRRQSEGTCYDYANEEQSESPAHRAKH